MTFAGIYMFSLTEDGIDLYDAVKADQSESNMDKVLSLFDESAPDYAQIYHIIGKRLPERVGVFGGAA